MKAIIMNFPHPQYKYYYLCSALRVTPNSFVSCCCRSAVLRCTAPAARPPALYRKVSFPIMPCGMCTPKGGRPTQP
jgi:hypothetical protein